MELKVITLPKPYSLIDCLPFGERKAEAEAQGRIAARSPTRKQDRANLQFRSEVSGARNERSIWFLSGHHTVRIPEVGCGPFPDGWGLEGDCCGRLVEAHLAVVGIGLLDGYRKLF
jgi:hypothetical protein